MTADGLAGELPIGVILALCDKLLGEVGRRSHRFAWLRAPGQVADAWLPVEAYYPRHRLVVVCHSGRTPYDHLFRQLVPEHGLRLLQFSPRQLSEDPDVAEQMLGRMLAGISPPAASAPGRAPRARPTASTREPGIREPRERSARPSRSARPARAERPGPKLPSISLPSFAGLTGRRRESSRPVPSARRAPTMPRARAGGVRAGTPARADTVAMGVVAGLVLAAICGAELVVGVIPVGLGAGRLVLGLGIAFDACARALGALDAGRLGKVGLAWGCAIIGSPAVAAAAATRPRTRAPAGVGVPGNVAVEPAPLAGLIAMLALVCIVVGLVS